jgi:hypothetical protein
MLNASSNTTLGLKYRSHFGSKITFLVVPQEMGLCCICQL